MTYDKYREATFRVGSFHCGKMIVCADDGDPGFGYATSWPKGSHHRPVGTAAVRRRADAPNYYQTVVLGTEWEDRVKRDHSTPGRRPGSCEVTE